MSLLEMPCDRQLACDRLSFEIFCAVSVLGRLEPNFDVLGACLLFGRDSRIGDRLTFICQIRV